MNSHQRLSISRKQPDGEFYTRRCDIDKELPYYDSFIGGGGKTIYCNCDRYDKSQFVAYFKDNFERLHLKKLIATNCSFNGDIAYCYILDEHGEHITRLQGTGSYDSPECEELLNQCDFVITNPPFNEFKHYIPFLMERNKKILIIGTITAANYKLIFPYLQKNQLWFGHNYGMFHFLRPDYIMEDCVGFAIDNDGDKKQSLGHICWYTNIGEDNFHNDYTFKFRYNPVDYPKLDNYCAINCNSYKHVPIDYDGVIAVPTTYLCHYDPTRYRILGCSEPFSQCVAHIDGTPHAAYLNGKKLFTRIFIQKI